MNYQQMVKAFANDNNDSLTRVLQQDSPESSKHVSKNFLNENLNSLPTISENR